MNITLISPDRMRRIMALVDDESHRVLVRSNGWCVQAWRESVGLRFDYYVDSEPAPDASRGHSPVRCAITTIINGEDVRIMFDLAISPKQQPWDMATHVWDVLCDEYFPVDHDDDDYPF
jgi:hypothetical protein